MALDPQTYSPPEDGCRVVARGQVFAGRENTNRQSGAFPGICVLPSGRWLCSFRAAPAKSATTGQHVLLTHSDDEGATWSTPGAPFAPPKVEGKPGLFRVAYLTAPGGARVVAVLMWVDHSNPALPFFNEATEGLLDSRIFLSHSEDDGHSWSPPRLMETAPFQVPTPITGPILLLPNGEWACQFELNKHYDDTAPWHHQSVLMFSRDEGASWREYSIASSDPENRIFYWDQRPSVLADGMLLNLFWTYDTCAAEYLNIHARKSLDDGRSWSAMWETSVSGQPAPPVSLPDGKLALVYVERSGAPTIEARISGDGGHTWPQNTRSILYRAKGKSQTDGKDSMPGAWEEMGQFSVGLPATAPLPDGDVLVTYYCGAQTDHTAIEWARLRANTLKENQ